MLDYYRFMAKQFRVGQSTVSSVVMDVYQAIIALIRPPRMGRDYSYMMIYLEKEMQ